MSYAIRTIGLEKRFGKHIAVSDLDLRVEHGSVVGLIGSNGAGKTTTLRMLVDIIRPTSGRLQVLGQTPRSAGPALRRRIGYLPGDLRVSTRASGRQILDFYARVSGPVRPGRVEELAERLQLDLARPVKDLSKGNKQKLGLIQAFMHSPELLILDEPTSGLDPLIQREFLQMVREAREGGSTIVLSSHVLSEIQQVADQLAVLSVGRLVAEGSVGSVALSQMKHVRVVFSADDRTVVEQSLATLPNTADVLTESTSPDTLTVTFSYAGDITALLRVLSGFDVRDLTIAPPDLEEAVLHLYDGAQVSPSRHDNEEGEG
jgi:ABC-2 type transport system ATP-binding protein